MARKYNKQSPYWENRKNAGNNSFSEPLVQVVNSAQQLDANVMDWAGEKTVVAACGGVGSGTVMRNSWSDVIVNNNLYPNLSAGIMPFSAEGGYYTMSVPINLATLAYFNIPLVRNTINLLQDFSISPLHVRTSNKTVKAFFTRWFEAINLSDLMAQWFLEYYRSGNIFIYKFNGKIEPEKFAKMKTAFAAAKSPELPIRYIILDPKQVYLQVGPTYNQTYVRMLSTFEIERLRNPQTPEDRQMLKDFPPDIQKQIKQYSATPWIYAPLDTSRLYYCFYRKQDYEPLAVPMIFPLINRLEYKLMLEKMDMSLVQTMEQVFLHVSSGSQRDQYNPGTNPKALERLQQMFQTQTIGRVLVTDHNTKAEWKIPDLKELLGKGKYEQVDKDIRDGLGYQFFGEDKFANASIKAKLFIEGLREGRRVFLDNFLRPEIKKICQALGFKNVPTIEFEEINVEDQTALQRVFLQMAQLGLLTDAELNQALKTGMLPDKEASLENQKAYKKERDDGLYTPLAPEAQGADEQGRPAGSGGTKSPAKKTGKIGTRASIDPQKLSDAVFAITDLEESFKKAYKKQYKLKDLNSAQETFVTAAVKAIVVNEPQDKWHESIKTYFTEAKNIPQEINLKIAEIASEFQVDGWKAVAILKATE